MLRRAQSAFKGLRASLDESLFPPSPGGTWGLGRGESLVVLVAFLMLAVILQLLRVGPGDAAGSLWAEDGSVFMQVALTHNLLDAVTSTYAGYLVLVPRLIGEIAAAVPLRDAAPATALAASAVVALSGVAIWHGSSAYIRSPYLRGLLVALTVLSPVASLEAVSSGAYVTWYMTFATFWLLLWRPATTWGAALGGLFILATGLSSPGIVFFLPLAVLRAIAARDRRDALILGPFALALAIQLPVTALSDEGTVTPVWTSDIWTTYLQRVVDGSVFGEALGGEMWTRWGWPFLIALLVLVVIGLAVGVARSSARNRWFAAIAIATSLVMFVASAYQRAVGTAMMWPPHLDFGLGGRYAIVPSLLLISVVLVLVDQRARAPGGRVRAAGPAVAATAVLLVALVTSFPLGESVARGTPSWDDGLRAAAAACQREGLAEAAVETSPPGFGVLLPCDRLQSLFAAPAAD
jgi:hypothetical protein